MNRRTSQHSPDSPVRSAGAPQTGRLGPGRFVRESNTLDFRHGPIAVAGPRSLMFLFGDADDRLVADIQRTGARVETSQVDPLVQLVTAQRIALALAESRGLTPDTPRYLTPSVVLS